MATVKTKIGTEESARKLRVEPTGGITATNTQKALEGLDTAKITATGTLTTHAMLVATGATSAGTLGLLTDGQLMVGQTGADPLPKTITGALSLTAAGVTALTASAFANPTASIGLTAVNGSALTAMRSDGAPALSQAIVPTWTGAHTHNPTSGDAITVNPAALSTAKAWASTQSTPTSGTIAGPFALNLWNLTYSFRVTGSGSDATGNNNAGAVGFRVNQTITTAGVASTSAPIITGLFSATVSTTTAITDVTGLAGTAYTNVAMSGAYLEGLNGVAQVGPTGSANILVGVDAGAFIQTGGTATNRIGLSINSGGSVSGTTLDAAMAFNANSATIKFGKVFAFSNLAGQAPIGTSTDIFYADTAYSVANFASLANMTVSGNILNFSKFALSGDGRIVLGGNNNTLAAFPVVLQAKQASGGSATINSATNTTSGFSGFDVLTSGGAVEAFLQVNEAARTAVRFGQTIGSWAEIGSTGGNGLVFGTEDNTPLIIGTNNTARIRVTGAGLTNIGTDVTTLATLTVNKNTAASIAAVGATALFQIASADSVQPVMLVDSFGTAVQPFIVTRIGRGTAASFTASLSGDNLGFFGMVGATAANTFASNVGAAGGVYFGGQATENWGAGAQGSKIIIYTTPNTTAAIAAAATFQASGGVSIGNTTDPAAGGIDVNGQAYFPNMATTASAANVFINTGSTPAGQLQRVTSSLIYKRDVEPLEQARALNVLRGAKPIWYRSKCAADNQKWSWYGLGAEEMAALDPRLVHFGYQDADYEEYTVEEPGPAGPIKRKDRRLKAGAALKADSVQYERLTVHLITGWQSHEARIAALESAQARAH